MLMKALQSSVDRQDKDVYPEGTSTAVTSDEDESYDSVSQKRADAIAEMAESYLENGPAESSSADRYQVILHVTAETHENTGHREASQRPWRSDGDCFGGCRLAMMGHIMVIAEGLQSAADSTGRRNTLLKTFGRASHPLF